MTFYNTIHLPKDILIEELKKVKKQELKVLAVFKVSLMKGLTPPEVFFALQEVYLIGNVRRSITDLTNSGKLVKTKRKRMGMHGKPNCVWEIKE